jgi:hypothetical protein
MSIDTRSREGRYEAVYRRERPAPALRVLHVFAAATGTTLLLAPVLRVDAGSILSVIGIAALLAPLGTVAFLLAAEASRRERVVASLHVASGELKVRSGRGPFAKTRALGCVEVDGIALVRGPSARTFRLLALVSDGTTMELLPGDADESALRDFGLALSQGMSVPLDDRRYAETTLVPRADRELPPRVTASLGDRNRTYAWEYRDRLRPRLVLLFLGIFVAGATALPALGIWLIGPAIALTGLGLGLSAHVVASLTRRRVTQAEDSVHVERRLSGLPLLSRLAPFESLKAVLVFRKGPLAVLHLRTAGGVPGIALPFEDPSLAGWLKTTIERAAHDAGQSAYGRALRS